MKDSSQYTDDDDGPAWRELHVLGPEEGRQRAFIAGEVSVSKIAWTPDGTGIAFLAKRDGDEETALYVIPADGGEARRVLSHAATRLRPSGSPRASSRRSVRPHPLRSYAARPAQLPATPRDQATPLCHPDRAACHGEARRAEPEAYGYCATHQSFSPRADFGPGAALCSSASSG